MADNKELKFQKYIFFSIFCESASLAWHLQKAGKDVIFAQVDNLNEVKEKEPEEKETHRRRMNMWTGILNKVKAEDYIKKMEKIENKDDYFVIFDFNNLWMFAKEAKRMGFKYGFFPNKFDYELEDNRQLAKEFVQSYYPELKVAECFEYKSVDEALEMVNESEEFWALKANKNAFNTVVPSTKNLQFAKDEIADALNINRKEAESKGFVLERQIRDGVEFCVERIYWNGKPIAHSVDLENKAIGSGNIGIKVGCIQNMIVSIPDDAPIISKCFPEAVDKLAKKHDGLFFIDANLIMKDGEFYFLEFCTRWGFDSTQTECEMSGGVENFFGSIVNGENPFKVKYGVGVRGINMIRGGDGDLVPNLEMRWTEDYESHIYPFDMSKDEKGKMINNGFEYELLSVFTGSSDDAEYAIIKAYEVVDDFSFKEMYTRPYHDFICCDYDGAIMTRLEAIEGLICSPELPE